jgi:hypothetical protein
MQGEFMSIMTLSQEVTLHISIIILASPDIASFTLEGIGNHIINKTMFIPSKIQHHDIVRIFSREVDQTTQDGNLPYSSSLKFGFPVSFINLLEDVLKPEQSKDITSQSSIRA